MSYCSRSCRRRFTVLDFKSWAFRRISDQSHWQSATFALRMRRNGYLCTSGVNLDTAVRFADPDFLLGCNISAIWRRFPLIIAFYILNVRHISTSGLFDLLTYKVYHTTHVDPHVDNSHQVWSWYDHPLPSYSVFVCWYVTWPGDLSLWPFDPEQLSYMAGNVVNVNPVTKFEDPLISIENAYVATAHAPNHVTRE